MLLGRFWFWWEDDYGEVGWVFVVVVVLVQFVETCTSSTD